MARLFHERLAEDHLVVQGEDHHYLSRVLRLRPGDEVVLFDGRGHEAVARIGRIGPRAVELDIVERREVALPSGPRLTLLVGLAKGEKLDLVVQKATELGAHSIIPVHTARSIPLREARRPRWMKIAREAARQSGRSDVPEISSPVDWAAAIESAPAGLRILFWEAARSQKLRDLVPTERPADIVVAVGPEGGFEETEVELARQHGFVVAGLGPRTLRAETAAIAALAVVGYALGDLG